jgi:hypothetical protein
VVVTGLDPASTLLRQRYEDAIGAAAAIDLAGFYPGAPPPGVALVPAEAAPL